VLLPHGVPAVSARSEESDRHDLQDKYLSILGTRIFWRSSLEAPNAKVPGEKSSFFKSAAQSQIA